MGLGTVTHALAGRLAGDGVPLFSVTGASKEHVVERIRSGELPSFACLTAAVGTEVYLLQGGEYVLDPEWRLKLAREGFDRAALSGELQSLVAGLNRQHSHWNIVTQDGRPEPFKISFWYMARTVAEAEEIYRLLAAPFAHFRTVWCEDINYAGPGKRFCFDVLAADKRDAVAFLVERFGINAGLVCGDSGNDTSMLFEGPKCLTGVIVGGARQQLISAATERVVSNADQFSVSADGRKFYLENDPTRKGPQSILHVYDLLF